MNELEFDQEFIIPSEIKLTDLEVNMFKSHGIRVFDVEKMSKEELTEAYNYFVKMGM